MLIRTLGITVFLAAAAGCASGPQTHGNNTGAPVAVNRNALNCAPMDTATRLPPRPDACATGNVRTYSGEQLEQTGATQVGDALHYLDPEITIVHH